MGKNSNIEFNRIEISGNVYSNSMDKAQLIIRNKILDKGLIVTGIVSITPFLYGGDGIYGYEYKVICRFSREGSYDI